MNLKPTSLSDNSDDGKILSNHPIEHNRIYTRISPHSYPTSIILFWGIAVLIFIVSFLKSCAFQAPHHIIALRKISMVKAFVKNKEYFNALKIHKELCSAYPCSYANSYAIDIASTCFECCNQNYSLLKEGLYVLRGKKLEKEEFLKLAKTVPLTLREAFLEVFDGYSQEKHGKKEYHFVVNNDRVKLL